LARVHQAGLINFEPKLRPAQLIYSLSGGKGVPAKELISAGLVGPKIDSRSGKIGVLLSFASVLREVGHDGILQRNRASARLRSGYRCRAFAPQSEPAHINPRDHSDGEVQGRRLPADGRRNCRNPPGHRSCQDNERPVRPSSRGRRAWASSRAASPCRSMKWAEIRERSPGIASSSFPTPSFGRGASSQLIL
jgi:hypothetical protein